MKQTRPNGGIGRHNGLKIRCSKEREGSSPSSATIMLTPDPVAKWRSFKKVAGHQSKGADDYLAQASITGVKICVQQSCRGMIESWYRIGAGGVFFKWRLE